MFTFPNFFTAFPGAGGNWQTIDTRWWSPNVSVNFAGNPAVEREVTEDVASYGRQISWLNDIVTALVEIAGAEQVGRHGKAAESLKKLKDAQQKIDAIKARRKDQALDNARGALANLAESDKPAYERLVRLLDVEMPPAT
jgi:hypothetical protein